MIFLLVLTLLTPSVLNADPCAPRAGVVATSPARIVVLQKTYEHDGPVKGSDPVAIRTTRELAAKVHGLIPQISQGDLESGLFFAIENACQHGKLKATDKVTFEAIITKSPHAIEITISNPSHAPFPPALLNRVFTPHTPVFVPDYQRDASRGKFGLGAEFTGEELKQFGYPHNATRQPSVSWQQIGSQILFKMTLPTPHPFNNR